MHLALGSLLAGIVGNLIDRIRMGGVVDFLDFHWGEKNAWLTFNLADIAICFGAAILLAEICRRK
jgi:lipoprotein signal peptidase